MHILQYKYGGDLLKDMHGAAPTSSFWHVSFAVTKGNSQPWDPNTPL